MVNKLKRNKSTIILKNYFWANVCNKPLRIDYRYTQGRPADGKEARYDS